MVHTCATRTCPDVTPPLLTSPGPPQSAPRHLGGAASWLPCAGAPCQQPPRAPAGAAPGAGYPPVPDRLPPAPKLQTRPNNGVNSHQPGRKTRLQVQGLHADVVNSPPYRLSAVQHAACVRSTACFSSNPDEERPRRYQAGQECPIAHSCMLSNTRQQGQAHSRGTATQCSTACCPGTALHCQPR